MIKNSINTTTLAIADIIAPIVSSRDIVNKLKNNISKLKAEMVYLDFAKVDFISRSAAHELLSLKEDFRRKLFKKKEVDFINTNDDVKKMLRVVAMNKAVPEKNKPKFEAEVININSLIISKTR